MTARSHWSEWFSALSLTQAQGLASQMDNIGQSVFFYVGRQCKGSCQVKENLKIREKLESGWVGQAPTRIFFFYKCCVFWCFLCLLAFFKCFKKKKLDRGWVGVI